ncbi:MAG: hypothetical protein QOI29_5096, partial [Mycobacterium sp.]|nr:hypothetical protein [Mycobacterium sp.]
MKLLQRMRRHLCQQSPRRDGPRTDWRSGRATRMAAAGQTEGRPAERTLFGHPIGLETFSILGYYLLLTSRVLLCAWEVSSFAHSRRRMWWRLVSWVGQFSTVPAYLVRIRSTSCLQECASDRTTRSRRRRRLTDVASGTNRRNDARRSAPARCPRAWPCGGFGHSEAACSCGWTGRRRYLKAAAEQDAWMHSMHEKCAVSVP